MNLQIVGKNMDVPENVRDYIEKKTKKLERHFSQITQGEVGIARETTKSPQNRYVVQLTLTHGGNVLRCEEKSSDILAAINSVLDVMDRRIEHYKGKLYEKGKKSHQYAFSDESTTKIVKENRLTLEIMSAEEAAEQMEQQGSDNFLFINEKSQMFSSQSSKN